ncbi:hypothetical protein CG709_18445, partial [Lachnotalea glycerini]
MKNVLFVKYNRTRRINYQISTSIYEENGISYVEKKALNVEAIPHIESLKEKSGQISKVLKNIEVLLPNIQGKSAIYEFIDGVTLQDSLFELIDQKDTLLKQIDRMNERIFSFHTEYLQEFQMSDQFREIFGDDALDLKGVAVKPANIDSMYDNFIEKDDKLYCLDC